MNGLPAIVSARIALMLAFFLVLTTCWFSTRAAGQDGRAGSEDVHITPHPQPARLAEAPALGASLNTHTAPIKKNVDLVLVPVTITDPMDRLVTGLEKDNFQVFDGKEKQDIQNFSNEDAPVSVGIIFDMSGSMRDKIDRAREAVIEFCKTANPQDEFFMISFSDEPHLAAGFTSNPDDIQNKLIYTIPKGRTALLDALYLGMHKMKEAKNQRKALLIISDGGDNHSRYTEDEIKSQIKEGDVIVYGIGVYDTYFSTIEERLGPQLLSEISQVTGGRTFTIDNPNDLPDVASKIGMELRNQYVLGYKPSKTSQDGKWHKIKVKLRIPRGLPPLQVYARTGYYAPSQ
ncbi:MAG: VWA domain-containing protein [Acidobacteria bacterium]|nr:VWA domain-containing protein [Acidobacteriota bacterium]